MNTAIDIRCTGLNFCVPDQTRTGMAPIYQDQGSNFQHKSRHPAPKFAAIWPF